MHANTTTRKHAFSHTHPHPHPHAYSHKHALMSQLCSFFSLENFLIILWIIVSRHCVVKNCTLNGTIVLAPSLLRCLYSRLSGSCRISEVGDFRRIHPQFVYLPLCAQSPLYISFYTRCHSSKKIIQIVVHRCFVGGFRAVQFCNGSVE